MLAINKGKAIYEMSLINEVMWDFTSAVLCDINSSSVVKLSWLTRHFAQLNNHDDNLQQLERFTRAWILRFIGSVVLFVDKNSNKIFLSVARMHGNLL